jgi:predicted acylesterase/phospholipase RssA
MSAYPSQPPLECDLIMKGGITSGIIYPGVVCRLARVYRLRSVGGASAGAIAAGAAAAAELGRDRGGFEKLAALPDRLTAPSPAGGSVLFRLFQPGRETAGLFRLATAGLGTTGVGRALRMLVAAVRGAWLACLLGTLPGAALVVAGATADGWQRVVVLVLGVLVLALGLVAGAAAGAARRLARAVPAHGYGLCSGMPGATRPAAPALTPWLHALLQDLSGRDAGAPPLTFGDLDAAGIQLKMMTTNVTRRQPIALPYAGREFFFDPAEWRALFPPDVVGWLEEHPPPVPTAPEARFSTEVLRRQALPLRPLPGPADLPVVVATRMSLSFPLLISAVPLHAVDYQAFAANRAARAAAQAWRQENPAGSVEDAVGVLPRPEFGVHWFSDGGICSNLPIHFFDTPLPTRPTFGVDLARFPPEQVRSDDEADNSYLPIHNQAGAARRCTAWGGTGIGALAGFGRSILDSARAWVDESQLVMPGYRDRIVTIFHDDSEGGLNLSMPETVVTRLTHRGEGAAGKLVDRFAGADPGVSAPAGWDNHRWIRFRTATSGLEEWLASFAHGYHDPTGPCPPYSALAGPGADAPLPSYPLTVSARSAVNTRTGALDGLAAEWNGPPPAVFGTGAPAPGPTLRLVPGADG